MSDNNIKMLPKLHGNIGLKVEGANENNRWSKSTDDSVTLFIKGIVTAEGKDGIPTELLRAMISGIPSPWARVLMTRKALAVKPEDLNMTVLDECYKMFRSEWRGLVAAYALRPDSFEFSKAIPLCGRSLADNYGEMITIFKRTKGKTPIVIGNGSNLLVTDNGIDGVVIKIGSKSFTIWRLISQKHNYFCKKTI